VVQSHPDRGLAPIGRRAAAGPSSAGGRTRHGAGAALATTGVGVGETDRARHPECPLLVVADAELDTNDATGPALAAAGDDDAVLA